MTTVLYKTMLKIDIKMNIDNLDRNAMRTLSKHYEWIAKHIKIMAF